MRRAARTDLAAVLAGPALLVFVFVLAGCQAPAVVPPATFALAPISFADLRGWGADQPAPALAALRRSCDSIADPKRGRDLGPDYAGRPEDWAPACQAARSVAAADAVAVRRFFEGYFRAYRVTGESGDEGLFTGYYSPELRGSFVRQGRYVYPLYAKPADLPAGKPSFSRAEIEAGALRGKGLELLWVDDPIDAFFLQVQGSGRILLDDGKAVLLGFAAHNGRPYTAIGRVLVDEGALAADRVSMQAIRDWMLAHPARAAALMARNERFVFFRRLEGEAPVGAQGVALTAGRSLAVDNRFIPFGAPLWLDTVDPLDRITPLRRLMVAQDTGAAIKGAVRGDFFWGFGPEAGERAGRMQERGRYYLLLPRTIDPVPRS